MPTGAVRTAPRNGFPRARGTVDRAQGPDSSAATRADYQPPVVDCAGREAAGTTVSVYVHGSPSLSGHQRFVAARERVELLAEAGVVEDARYVAWPARAEPPTTGDGVALEPLSCAFVDAAGRDALEPFFERVDGAPVVSKLALAVRDDGTLAALYPQSRADGTETVEDGLSRLLAGDDVENLVGDRDGATAR